MKPEFQDLKRVCANKKCLHLYAHKCFSEEDTCPIWQKWAKQETDTFTVEQVKEWMQSKHVIGNWYDVMRVISDPVHGLAAHARREQK